ncbi:hypothetical protein ACFOD0_04230 [Shewanella intestini]|uniref:Uncharacterized protein n=1 Tax=Shewanella intestini TaxID=2017544 RepID=A0ABS5I285_9GAMM|nr:MULTISPECIES: hypothetical protein [Shewanella]MBR9727510.1 hypothetical protein [Shewanella intestini]MRG35340.1 hypothetical protein [Shewanella sp. XMDDZSB0408]
MNQLELLATAIVTADTWTPRRWVAKFGGINIAQATHLNKDYREARKTMFARLPEQASQEHYGGLSEHRVCY